MGRSSGVTECVTAEAGPWGEQETECLPPTMKRQPRSGGEVEGIEHFANGIQHSGRDMVGGDARHKTHWASGCGVNHQRPGIAIVGEMYV